MIVYGFVNTQFTKVGYVLCMHKVCVSKNNALGRISLIPPLYMPVLTLWKNLFFFFLCVCRGGGGGRRGGGGGGSRVAEAGLGGDCAEKIQYKRSVSSVEERCPVGMLL